jgi:outer membrane protein OmpA-like peptidoglycan-associated protein
MPGANVRPVAVAAVLVATSAGPAFAGPDFVAGDRTAPLAASDGRSEQQPMDDIVFAFDSAALLPGPQAQIARAANWLATHPAYRIVIEGYADSSGPAAYNEDLATRRGQIVRNHLVACGVAPDRILLAVFGENRARERPDELDRRVVMYASAAPIAKIISAELDRDAIEMLWTRGATRFRESRGITPLTAVATRR